MYEVEYNVHRKLKEIQKEEDIFSYLGLKYVLPKNRIAQYKFN